MSVHLFLLNVEQEIDRARRNHAPIHSAHEGYAVLLEEMDELKAEVWKKRADSSTSAMLEELVQIAAMACRMAEDVLGATWKGGQP